MSQDPRTPRDDGREWQVEREDWWPDYEGDHLALGGQGAETPGGAKPPAPHPERIEDQRASQEGRGRAVARGGALADGERILADLGAPLRPRPRRTRRTVRKQDAAGRARLTGEQRLLLLDAWLRSKLPAKDFAALVGVSKHTLYKWKHLFETEGPAGLADKPRGRREGKRSRLPEATQRAILMLKEAHPEWGEDRIHHVLARGEGFRASPGAIGRVLAEAGYVVEHAPTRPHRDKKRRFERARPNQLWQTDLFTFVLKREQRRVHLVGYLDDHSRFLVAWGLHASSSGKLVREVFEEGIARFGAPQEVLTDNGSQYTTWRGKSAFTQLCERRGIRQIVSRPRHPQTLGKIERFWQSLWRECVGSAIFRGIDEARERIGHYVDHYNFQRPHSGIGSLVPADRYFAASEEVRRTLEARVRANALDLARHGEPRKPFYLTGRVGDTSLSLHAEGDRVVLMRGDGEREEVDLSAPGRRAEPAREEPATEAAEQAADETDEEATRDVEDSEAPQPEGRDGPLIADSSPPDPAWTEDDEDEPAPGRSVLDGILRGLRQRWPRNPALEHGSEPEGGQER